mgnify:CR=1 FL=1
MMTSPLIARIRPFIVVCMTCNRLLKRSISWRSTVTKAELPPMTASTASCNTAWARKESHHYNEKQVVTKQEPLSCLYQINESAVYLLLLTTFEERPLDSWGAACSVGNTSDLSSVNRELESHQRLSLLPSARNYSHCLVLVGSRNIFELDITIKLK